MAKFPISIINEEEALKEKNNNNREKTKGDGSVVLHYFTAVVPCLQRPLFLWLTCVRLSKDAQ